MQWLNERITNEPVLTVALINAAISMAVGFGLGWTGEQVTLVNVFATALLSWIARKQVTPNSKL